MGAIIVVAITFVMMWVLFILPQQKRVKAHQALVQRLEVGDEVMTSTGMYGTITELDDEVVSMEIAPGTVARFARAAIAQRLAELTPTDEPGPSDDDPATNTSDPVDADASDPS